MRSLKKLLQELADTGLVRVTGSYADGTNHVGSDIDFRVKVNKDCKLYGGINNNNRIIYNILKKYKIKLYSNSQCFSTIPTQGCYVYDEDNPHMEFSDCFTHRKNRLKNVTILGVKFKTY